MWSKEFYKYPLRASTLVELLVVIAITSIVFLSLTEGFTLFGQYSRQISKRIVSNATLWDGYCRLESVVSSADSLLMTPSGKVEVYGNSETGTLIVSDGLLLFSRSYLKDTLFHSVIDIHVSRTRSGPDSLITTFATGDDKLRIAFATSPKPKIRTDELKEMEEQYGYK